MGNDAAIAGRRRDIKVTGLIGVAHFLSHFYQLTLPALFPLIHAEEGIGYAALGALVTVFFFLSGAFQTPAGFLVDRLGGRRMLIGGMALLAASIVALSDPDVAAALDRSRAEKTANVPEAPSG